MELLDYKHEVIYCYNAKYIPLLLYVDILYKFRNRIIFMFISVLAKSETYMRLMWACMIVRPVELSVLVQLTDSFMRQTCKMIGTIIPYMPCSDTPQRRRTVEDDRTEAVDGRSMHHPLLLVHHIVYPEAVLAASAVPYLCTGVRVCSMVVVVGVGIEKEWCKFCTM